MSLARQEASFRKCLTVLLGNKGSQPFGPLDLIVEPPVLIPRPETEHWALLLSQRFKEASSANAERRKRLRILDICSGTGCIGLLLAKELIHSWNIELHGMDVSSHAVDLARRNARLHDLDAVSTFHQADVFANADLEHLDLPSFDLVVSNPPYIPSSEMRELDRSVKEHESLLALEGVYPRSKGDQQVEHDGLDFYRRLKEIYTEHLASKPASDLPKVAVEVGKGQADVISEMFGKDRSRIVDDYAGIGRSVWIH